MVRQKKVLVQNVSREAAEQAFGDYAAADAKFQNISSKMDMEITKIRDKYSDQLAELSTLKEEKFEIIQAFALENKELFSKKKSIESTHGVFGFRTGTPKLKNMKGFTWASVLNLVKEFLPEYIRTAEEIAKDKLLADRDKENVFELFPKCGVMVVQDEAFYVEPKKENEQLS
jgi:phage host-nuclease inhibitor protein Gam